MTLPGITNIGLIGAGHIGSAIARLAVRNDYTVVVSNSRGPESLEELVDELGPHASAALAEHAAQVGDLVVVTIPLGRFREVPVEPLEGKIVIDTNNYYPGRDGQIPELDSDSTTSSALLQEHLPTSRVVKVFNNIGFADIPNDAKPVGTPGRRALPVASDDDEAKATVIALLDEFGYDAVDVGSLADSWRYQPDTPAYGVPADADGMRKLIDAAER
ncbi:NADPH-dependent F420 reductase [Naasia lichenicola]|uniref:NADPH-dependent F420 reductase n=1 Tax=Naasia lichenicola TaxID=2565933 RepID=UPI001E4DD7A6|nr:NADPH-dependent F420 reductase [Naasia lichenicola]